MTGYGRKTIKHRQDTMVTVEIKTINSRYLDILSKIPRKLQSLELELKNVLKDCFKRGRIELYISISGEAVNSQNLHINWQLMDQFVAKMHEMKDKYHITDDISLDSLTRHDEVFEIYEVDTTDESLYESILNNVQVVAEAVIATRIEEGQKLKEDIQIRTQKLENLLQYIVAHHETEQKLYRERIKARIAKQIEKAHALDESYFIQEVALLSEKGSIQEELTRLDSHLIHFKQTLEEDNEVGRKLDFIVQELNREINTIGAKSIDPKISEKTILIKSEIEKIKEQIQNIE